MSSNVSDGMRGNEREALSSKSPAFLLLSFKTLPNESDPPAYICIAWTWAALLLSIIAVKQFGQ